MKLPIGSNAFHLCIDMQRMFSEATDWHTPTLQAVVPNVVAIARAKPERTFYARFVVPSTPDDAKGAWQGYYRRWSGLTRSTMAAGLLDLVEPLASMARANQIFDKPTYSLFEAQGFQARLEAVEADTLVFTGVETDICVLATLFDAIDKGFRTIVVADAVTSSSLDSHRAVLDILLPRMPQQVTISTTTEVLSNWR